MAIESANVSKPVIREVEKTSGSNPWSSMQGSSTEGKDSPFSSIWEKTVDGAQKLFGLESSKQAPQGETFEEEDKDKKQQSATTSEAVDSQESLNSVPGFGGNSFSYFAAGRRRMDTSAFAGVSTTRIAPETVEVRFPRDEAMPAAREESYDVATPKIRRDDSQPIKEKARYQQKEKVSVEEDDGLEPSEKKASESKMTVPVAARPAVATTLVQGAPVSPVAAEASQSNVQSAQGLPVAAQAQALSASPPEKAATQVRAATDPRILETGNTAKAEVPTQFTTSKQTQTQPQVPVQPLLQQPQQQAQVPVGKQVPVSTPQTTTPVPQATADKSTPVVAVSSAQADAGKPVEASVKTVDEALAIAPEKANQALTEAMKKTAVARNENSTTKLVSQTAQASVSAQSSTIAQGESSQKSAQVESIGLKVPEQGGEVKGSPTQDVLVKENPIVANKAGQGVTNAKSTFSADQVAATRQSPVTESAPEASVTNASQRSQSVNTTAAAAGKTVRSAVGPVSVQSQNRPLGQNVASATGVTGVSAGANTAASSGSAGAQSQNGETGEGMKENLSTQLKNASTGKIAEKGSGDSGQAFDVKGLTNDASRKTEAAAKSRPTSYVSKTVEEMKEVVATLTKSIDRLVTTKPGTMNLRINFDQGGSMNIRITLDGSQVSTSMQTDVPGLEGMIKSNWSDLAGDWNQKGVKLSSPQFQQSADQSSGDSKDSWNDFAEKQQNRQSGSSGNTSRNAGRNSSSGTSENAEQEEPSTASQEIISDTELKTYA